MVALMITVRGDAVMQNPFTEIKPRIFNPMTASELSDEAGKAVKAAFDAISNWRADIVFGSTR